MSDREARLCLNVAAEPGDPLIAAAVQEFGAEEAWDRLINRDTPSPTAARAHAIEPEQILEDASRANARFIIPGDPEWPTQLADLTGIAPINEKTGIPLGLWITGHGDLAELAATAVTITGSRACTAYGEFVAAEVGLDLSAAGHTIVAGGGYGIDSAAHRGAMNGSTPTVVVLASGIDVPHPPAHGPLFRQVTERGLLVSELPPGQLPTRARFLARNRVLAALSQGTVVVEATARSGARHTAAWATVLERVVMAVPGPTTSAQSQTPNTLIRHGVARLVTAGCDVADNLAATGRQPVASPENPAPAWESVSGPAPRGPALPSPTAPNQARPIGL